MEDLLNNRISQDANYQVPADCVISVVTKDGMREGMAYVKRNQMTIAVLNFLHDQLDGNCQFYSDGFIYQKINYSHGTINGWCHQYNQGFPVKHELYDMGTCQKILVKVDNNVDRWYEYDPKTLNTVKIKELQDNYMIEKTPDSPLPLYNGKFDPDERNNCHGFQRHGEGVGYHENLIYTGMWKNDKPCGRGELCSDGRRIYTGEWNDGTFTLQDGRVYTYPNPILPDVEPDQPSENSFSTSPSENQSSKSPGQSKKAQASTMSKVKKWMSKRTTSQFVLAGIILLIGIGLIIGIVCWRSWYITSIDVTACTKEELDGLSTRMRSLTIPSSCANDLAITSLELTGFPRLSYITIGDKVMKYGQSLKITDCPVLRSIEIGSEMMNNVPNWTNNVPYDKSRVVKIGNCPELTSVIIGLGSFVAFDVFSLTNVPKLSYLQIGDLQEDSSCFHNGSLDLQNLPELTKVVLGSYGFASSKSSILSNLPKLKSLKLGMGALAGFASTSSIILRDLPALTEIVSMGYAFYVIDTVTIENIPNLETCILSMSFTMVSSKRIINASLLEAFFD